MIKEYDYVEDEKCICCGTTEDIVIDEDGDPICIDCLFERQCENLS